ncbi:hypothetical protein ACF1FX_34595 [Streptomyces sp. NPDC014646]|uniref:hypothetical protein n=1 Tax=Streptomyces sp. NPDC014646 TaxID=3364877 RepID=UPI0036F8489D
MSVRDVKRDTPQDPSAAADQEMSEEDFANAVFVRADEPEDDAADGVTITRDEFCLCAPEPLRLVVLMHWRLREQDGRPRTAGAIYAQLTELGMHGDDGVPVRLNEVTAAVDFLHSQGVISGAGGEL